MSTEIVEGYGLQRFASASLDKNEFLVRSQDEEIADAERAIYAFVVDEEIVRIGSSKGKLRNRMRSWSRDVSKRLRGAESSTPAKEAAIWRELLRDGRTGAVFARRGTEVETSVGRINVYLSEESHLIGVHQRRLNWSKHR